MSFLSFLDISLETANKFYSWGWKASFFGAAITLIGVILLMWGTRVRDHDFESQMGRLNTSTSQKESELKDAKSKITELENKLKPKPLDERIRNLLDQIDTRILGNLKRGRTEFTIDMLQEQFTLLQHLCSENKSSNYIMLEQYVNDGVGTRPVVKIILNPNLLE